MKMQTFLNMNLTDIMLKKIVALIHTMRPMTWISIIGTIFAGMMVSFHGIPPLQDIFLISVLLPILVLGYANSLNMYTDREIDKITRPDRTLPQGILKPKTVLYFSICLGSGALIEAFLFFNVYLTIFALAGILLSTVYSIRPTRIKAKGPVASISIAVGYVFIPYMGGAFAYPGITIDVILIAVILTIQTAGACVSKDFIDLKGDEKYEMDTVPLLMGLKKARRIVLAGLVFPLIVFPVLAILHVFPIYFFVYIFLIPWLLYISRIELTKREKIYIHSFFFCTVSVVLSGVAYTGIPLL